jgi:hypothetical protein
MVKAGREILRRALKALLFSVAYLPELPDNRCDGGAPLRAGAHV